MEADIVWDLGSGPGQARDVALARARQDGVPVGERMTWRILEAFARVSARGNATAEYRLAELYDSGRGVSANPGRAFQLDLSAARAGNARAMADLAHAYAHGRGAPRDASKAAFRISRTASPGIVEAQFDLAALYERGDGVTQSLANAYYWYTIAARGATRIPNSAPRRSHPNFPPSRGKPPTRPA